MRIRFATCFFVLLLTTPLAAVEEGIVEASGEAQIKGGDKVAAKKAAVADALRRAIEKVVGIYIESDFSSVQREVVKNNNDQFYSNVSDKLVQKAQGFIKSYDVLAEKAEGDVLNVTVRAHVFESKVKAELKSLADLIAAAGNPKLMVVIQEVHVAANGEQSVSQTGEFAGYIQEELLKLGFELRGKEKAADTADESVEAYDAWSKDVGGIARMAREAGADIVIEGRVEFRDMGKVTPEMAGGLDSLVGSTKLVVGGVVRGVDAATGDIFSVKTLMHKEFGSDFERGSLKRGKRINAVLTTFDQLLADATIAFKKTADRGQAYVVELKGVTSFRKQGKGFIKLLGDLNGVTSVKQKAFTGDSLEIDVLCKCSTEELQERIFSACDANASLSNIDIVNTSGKKLAFKL